MRGAGGGAAPISGRNFPTPQTTSQDPPPLRLQKRGILREKKSERCRIPENSKTIPWSFLRSSRPGGIFPFLLVKSQVPIKSWSPDKFRHLLVRGGHSHSWLFIPCENSSSASGSVAGVTGVFGTTLPWAWKRWKTGILPFSLAGGTVSLFLFWPFVGGGPWDWDKPLFSKGLGLGCPGFPRKGLDGRLDVEIRDLNVPLAGFTWKRWERLDREVGAAGCAHRGWEWRRRPLG